MGRPASKHAVGLDAGDPLTVRLIYFVPSDREAQDDIDEKLDSMIGDVRESYKEQMENHGFGSRTFRLETDAEGNAVVHHMTGKFSDAHYREQPWIWEEVNEQFDLTRNIYLVALDVSSEIFRGTCGLGLSNGPEGGIALLPASGKALLAEYGSSCFTTDVAAHELGHAFGLVHDQFRNSTRTPSSYHTDRMITSFHAAQWLDAHRYFNAGRSYTASDEQATIEMLSPLAVPPLSILLRFELSDPDGLHQAQLHNAGGVAIDSQGVEGQAATVEFVTTEVTEAPGNRVSLRVVDVHGNVTSQEHPVDITTLLPKESVSIPNANLGWLVRERLGLDADETLTQIDMLRLESLEATGLELADISGLESAVNLKALRLPDTQIEDLSPIAGSTILEYLDLKQNNVSDISSVSDMANLTGLALSGNAVTDLSPLAELAVLKYLELRGNGVSDILTLAGLANLVFLDLVGNPVTDLSPLEQLARLVRLDFGGDSVTDLSPVAGLTRLEQLNVVGDSITDLSPLAALTQLTHLACMECSVSDLSPLTALHRLTNLNLYRNAISDLSPLAGLTQLAYLSLAGNTVSDLSAVAGLFNLRSLTLWENPVSDLSPLAGLTHLRFLGLWFSPVSDLSPLARLEALTHLQVVGGSVDDVSALAGLTQLEELNVSGNSISDLSPLAGMPLLMSLYLASNSVTDIAPLTGLTGLRVLDLRGNPLSERSIDTYIPALRSRGVNVLFEDPQ